MAARGSPGRDFFLVKFSALTGEKTCKCRRIFAGKEGMNLTFRRKGRFICSCSVTLSN